MMKTFMSLIILIILAVWVIQSIRFALPRKPLWPGWPLRILASFLAVTGATGFLGSALSATSQPPFVGPSVEWPVGFAKGVLVTKSGEYVVAHPPSGRVQVYDRDFAFLRGWNVPSAGGGFKVVPSCENDIAVFTARGNLKIIYDSFGNELGRENYPDGAYSEIRSYGITAMVPTPFYLLVFAHPFLAWAVGVTGIGLMILIDRTSKPKGTSVACTEP
jgi:hypothetical protein